MDNYTGTLEPQKRPCCFYKKYSVAPDHRPEAFVRLSWMNNNLSMTRTSSDHESGAFNCSTMPAGDHESDAFNNGTTLVGDCQSQRKVEKQLRRVSRKLAETEVNIGLFNRMAKCGVPTNDVRHFVLNQTRMKQSSNSVQFDIVRKVMKNKLNDACSIANKLRQNKKRLKRLLCTKFNYSKSKHRKVMKEVSINTANHKGKYRIKTNKKYDHCKSKMNSDLSLKSLKEVPKDTWEIAQGVNIFNEEIYQEECIDPMVCSDDIELSKDELEFLRKGPRYMIRQNVKDEEFLVEIEKMIIKEKYDASSDGRAEESDHENGAFNRPVGGESDHENGAFNRPILGGDPKKDSDIEALSNEIAARAGMIYSKKDKNLNLGRLKATDYKFNKYVCLPRPESTYREAIHEIRKAEMLKVFRKTLEEKPRPQGRKKIQGSRADSRTMIKDYATNMKDSVSGVSVKSNLSCSEQRGMKSLQDRVKRGEIVVTETDKSRRYCVLKRSQYSEAGSKHTRNDKKISYDQLHCVQKMVNDHAKWLKKIFNIGSDWGHEERICTSMTDKGEVVSPLYLLVKDHKGWSQEDGTPPL